MRKYAIYGKGGIGKSTFTSSLSAAMADMGYRVMQIGCDPKADSTANLLGGREQTSVLSWLREHDGGVPELEDIVSVGYHGVYCIECGGPTPGIGCAGRGIITTITMLDQLNAFETYQPDFMFYDILGDVVCGGFAAPIRDGYADEVMIVTSGEKMALFAARNIYYAVENFKDRNYATFRGVVLNRRNIENEEQRVRAFAEEVEIPVIGDIPRDPWVQTCENEHRTVIEGAPDSPAARAIRAIAEQLAADDEKSK